MDFKKKVAEIRQTLDKEIVDSIDSILKEIESGTESLSTELIEVKRENKEKKLELRTLNGEIEAKDSEIDKIARERVKLQTEIKTLQVKSENPEMPQDYEDVKKERDDLKGQIEQFQQKWQGIVTERRNSVKTEIEKLAKHPKWEKAKSLLPLPDEKDGAFDWEKWEDDSVETAYSKLNELKAIDYFDNTQSHAQRTFSDMKNNQTVDPEYDKMTRPNQVMDSIVDTLDSLNR